MIPQIFLNKLTIAKIEYVKGIATRLGISYLHLLAVMYIETAKTFSTSIKNQIGSVGLIQFTRDAKGLEYKTIAGKRYFLRDIEKMNFFEQMDLVYLYFRENMKGKTVSSLSDVYLIVFFPNAVGKPENYVFETKKLTAKKIADANPFWNRNKDNQIVKKEITTYLKEYFKEDFELIKKKI